MPIDALTEARIKSLEVTLLWLLKEVKPDLELPGNLDDTSAIVRLAGKLVSQRIEEAKNANPG